MILGDDVCDMVVVNIVVNIVCVLVVTHTPLHGHSRMTHCVLAN